MYRSDLCGPMALMSAGACGVGVCCGGADIREADRARAVSRRDREAAVVRWRDGAELHLRIMPAQPTAGWAKKGMQGRLSLRCVPSGARVPEGDQGGGVKDVILCLYDITGNMAKPWLDAGYTAVLVDMQHKAGTLQRRQFARPSRAEASIRF